jgi:hypothetical protein
MSKGIQSGESGKHTVTSEIFELRNTPERHSMAAGRVRYALSYCHQIRKKLHSLSFDEKGELPEVLDLRAFVVGRDVELEYRLV